MITTGSSDDCSTDDDAPSEHIGPSTLHTPRQHRTGSFLGDRSDKLG
jgi:hypothetical protein